MQPVVKANAVTIVYFCYSLDIYVTACSSKQLANNCNLGNEKKQKKKRNKLSVIEKRGEKSFPKSVTTHALLSYFDFCPCIFIA